MLAFSVQIKTLFPIISRASQVVEKSARDEAKCRVAMKL